MSAREHLRVPWGWVKIGLLERIDPQRARMLLARQHRRDLRRAHAVKPLAQWERISPSSYSTYRGDPNAVRIRKVMDVVRPGDRVLDLGIGSGYVSGILLRDAELAYYCGTDLKQSYVDAARSMLAANGLEDRPHCFEVLNLYDLTAEFVRRQDPSLILLLEILEHVEDAGAALRTVAGTIDPGTRVLFTVPLLGRLEGVWGHRSVFDARRLELLCRESGLTVTHVTAVHGTWSLVVARRDAASANRRQASRYGTRIVIGALSASSRLGLGRRIPRSHAFLDLLKTRDRDSYARSNDTAEVQLRLGRAGVKCRASVAGDAAVPGTGGIRLHASQPEVVRLELTIGSPESVLGIHVTGHDRTGRQRMQWSRDLRGGPVSRDRETHVLSPGEHSRSFIAKGGGDPNRVEWLEVWMEAERGRSATMTVHRAAYVGSKPAATSRRDRPHTPSPPPFPFIVEVGRSGTAMLHVLLDAHPDLAIPAETRFVPDLVDACQEFAGPERIVELMTSRPQWNALGVAKDAVLERLRALDDCDATSVLHAFYALYAETRGKPRWGDKTAVYVKDMRKIERVLPEARFIHLIRDGRDVALSRRKRPRGEPESAANIAYDWARQIRRAQRQGKRLRHYMELRYEDLVADTEAALRRVTDFCGLGWDPAILRRSEHPDERAAEKEQMNPDDLAAFEAVAGDLLRELGYELHAPLGSSPGTPEAVHR